MHKATQSIDRRLFLGAGASTLTTLTTLPALAQQNGEPAKPGEPKAAPALPQGKRLSEAIADFVVDFELKDAPAEAINRARIALTDTIGVMLAGCRQDVSRILCDMVRLEGSVAQATIVGQSFKASPQLAALANGVASHAMDYDMNFIAGQAAAPVVPAILPVAEVTKASPAEIVAATIIGYEVSARIARANFLASSVGGWHTVGMVGILAAAAACSRLLKVSREQIPDVIGIAASMAGGLSVNFGSMTKPLHNGHAARDAVMAALLGAKGFTSNPASLEGHSGYFDDFGRGLDVTYEPFKDLGKRYDLVVLGYDLKAYPCGGLAHTSIEAALKLRPKLSARLFDIASIHCAVTRNAGQRAGTQYPASVENAKFSLAYMVAYSLVHGAPMISAFTEEAIKDDAVKAVAKTVTASVDPALGPGTRESPAIVTVKLSDGETFEQRVDYQTGSFQNPMTQAQIEFKFRDCAALSFRPDVADKILAVLNALPRQSSFDDFWPLVRSS